jgi:murein L,D-transpeptidase YafK
MRARMSLRIKPSFAGHRDAVGALRRLFAAGFLIVAAFAAAHTPANALTIELKDVAPDRIERQRAFAMGNLPLPGTPDIANLDQRLASKQLKVGDQVFIRIFKAESELEIWMKRGQTFVLLDIYPMCHWSGTVGPKVNEGDKQSPEGFYSVTRKQLHLFGRHPRSLDLGFPNALDQALNRTGSFILIHGGCSSVGCFAMTNTVTAEVYDLTEKALKNGQDRVNVHVFPFRMTEANLAAYQGNPWISFWRNLKQGYDAFEQTRVPPRVSICGKSYGVQRVTPGEAGDSGPLASCGDSRAATPQASYTSAVPGLNPVSTQSPPGMPPTLAPELAPASEPQSAPSTSSQRSQLSPQRRLPSAQTQFLAQPPTQQAQPGPVPRPLFSQQQRDLPFRFEASPAQMLARQSNLLPEQQNRAVPAKPACDLARPSCRRWSSIQSKLAATASLRPVRTARAR